MPTAGRTRPSLTEQELVGSSGARKSSSGPATPRRPRIELAARADVDLHRAPELLKNGCTPELALQILL